MHTIYLLDIYHISHLGMQNYTICLAWYDEDLQTQPKAKVWGENTLLNH